MKPSQHDLAKSSIQLSRRQLPENFESGDQVRLAVTVEACVVGSEQVESGDWLVSVKISNIKSTASETVGQGADRKLAERIRPVLWSTTRDGEVELVLDVGARQRLLALGISAKQKKALRKHLEALPVDEAEHLLREIATSRGNSANSGGHLSNGNDGGDHHEKG